MVSVLEWVLVGILVYTVVAMALKARGALPEYVKVAGPLTTLHTQRGKRFLTRLARPRRAWRAWANLGIGIALVIMVANVVLTGFAAYQSIVDPQPSLLTEPRNVLVIPGVSDLLPLSVAPEIITGLVIALIVHEGGHGLLCRVADIDIDSMGVALLGFIPIGAFVGPDEESVSRASRGDQTRMFVAGVTNNFAIAFIALALLFGPVIGAFSVVAGVPVGGALPGSPAAEAGIGAGDVIESVDGQPVANASELEAALAEADGSVSVGLRDGGTVTVDRRVYVTGVVQGGPVARGDTITHVNGTAVADVAAFREAVASRPVATLTLANGSTATTPVGAYTVVQPNRSFAAAGAPAGEGVIITAVDGERVVALADLREAIQATDPGQQVRIVGFVEGERRVFDVTMGSSGANDPHLGVGILPGTSGFTVSDFGIDRYPAAGFLDVLGGGDGGGGLVDGFLQRVLSVVMLPIAGIVGVFGYNFAGFTGIATNFYTVSGPLGVFGVGPAFLLANVLFWTGWLNLLVGQFNLYPTYPLDGGHVLRTITEAFVSRLPIENGRRVTTAITVAISALVIGALLTLILGPQLLA